MVGATLSVAVVEGEADAVGHGAESQPRVELLISHVFLHVPHVDLVGSRVNRRDASGGRRDSSLLISVLAILELDDLAHEDALGVSRVGAYSEKQMSLVGCNHGNSGNLPQKSVLKEAESATSAPPSTLPGENCVDLVAKLNILKLIINLL